MWKTTKSGSYCERWKLKETRIPMDSGPCQDSNEVRHSHHHHYLVECIIFCFSPKAAILWSINCQWQDRAHGCSYESSLSFLYFVPAPLAETFISSFQTASRETFCRWLIWKFCWEVINWTRPQTLPFWSTSYDERFTFCYHSAQSCLMINSTNPL